MFLRGQNKFLIYNTCKTNTIKRKQKLSFIEKRRNIHYKFLFYKLISSFGMKIASYINRVAKLKIIKHF